MAARKVFMVGVGPDDDWAEYRRIVTRAALDSYVNGLLEEGYEANTIVIYEITEPMMTVKVKTQIVYAGDEEEEAA